MKASIVTLLLLLSLSIDSIAIESSDASSVLSDSFESGFSPWMLFYNDNGAGTAATLSSEQSAHGRRHVTVHAVAKADTSLTSAPVRFEPNKTYTLSAYVKGTPGEQLTLEFYGVKAIRRWLPAVRIEKTVILTEEWQRVSVSGSLPELELNKCLIAFRPDNRKNCTFSVDAVQLEPGEEAGTFGSGAKPCFSFYFGEDCSGLLNVQGGVYTADDDVVLNGAVYNPLDAACRLSMVCELKDPEGETVFSEQKPLDVEPGQVTSFQWDFPRQQQWLKKFLTHSNAQKLGWYRVVMRLLDADGNMLDTQLSSFVRIADRTQPVPPDSPFGVCVLGNPDIEVERAAAIGVKHVRMHDTGFLWRNIYPQVNGSPEWTRPDRLVKMMSRAGLDPFPYVAAGKEPVDRGVPDKPAVPADLGKYENFWRELTSHYLGKMESFEVINEPYFSMGPEDCLNMHKAAYAGAKAGNPNCTLAGICGDPYFEGAFIDEILDLGAADYMDVMAIHIYTNPDMPEWALGKVLKATRQKLDSKGGKGMPIWITETGYKGEERSEIPQMLPASRDQWIPVKQAADWMVRTHVLSLGNGISRMYWFSLATQGPLVYSWSMNESDTFYSPKPAVAAYAAMTHQLEKMPFLDKPLDSGVYAYRFAKAEQNVAVVWCTENADGCLPVKADKVQVLDLFGNPCDVQVEDGIYFVPLTEAPYYVRSSTPVEPLQTVQISAPDEWDMNGTLPLTLTFSNVFKTALSGEWHWVLPDGWKVHSDPVQIALAPGQTVSRTVDVEIPAGERQALVQKVIAGRLECKDRPCMSSVSMLRYIRKPVAIEHDLWIEAEQPDQANFPAHGEKFEAAFSGAALKFDSRVIPAGSAGFSMQYNLEIKESASYEINYAGFPAGQVWSSPIEWKIDDGPFYKLITEPAGKSGYSPDPRKPNAKYYFFNIGTVKLDAGRHYLTLKVGEKRKTDGQYVMQLDSVFLKKIHRPE